MKQIFCRNLDTHCTQVRSFFDNKFSLELTANVNESSGKN